MENAQGAEGRQVRKLAANFFTNFFAHFLNYFKICQYFVNTCNAKVVRIDTCITENLQITNMYILM